jgi:hypothetical protein
MNELAQATADHYIIFARTLGVKKRLMLVQEAQKRKLTIHEGRKA